MRSYIVLVNCGTIKLSLSSKSASSLTFLRNIIVSYSFWPVDKFNYSKHSLFLYDFSLLLFYATLASRSFGDVFFISF